MGKKLKSWFKAGNGCNNFKERIDALICDEAFQADAVDNMGATQVLLQAEITAEAALQLLDGFESNKFIKDLRSWIEGGINSVSNNSVNQKQGKTDMEGRMRGVIIGLYNQVEKGVITAEEYWRKGKVEMSKKASGITVLAAFMHRWGVLVKKNKTLGGDLAVDQAFLLEKINELSSDLNAQAIGNICYGLQGSEVIPELQKVLATEMQKVDLDGQAIENIDYGLQGSEVIPELQKALAAEMQKVDLNG